MFLSWTADGQTNFLKFFMNKMLIYYRRLSKCLNSAKFSRGLNFCSFRIMILS